VEQGEGRSAEMRCDQEIGDVNPKDKEKGLKPKQNEIICVKCKEQGHVAHDCRLKWANNRKNLNLDSLGVVNQALCELISPLCAT
jgi:hypothetical protein